MRGSHPFQVRQVEGIKLAEGEACILSSVSLDLGPLPVEAESGCEPGFLQDSSLSRQWLCAWGFSGRKGGHET